MKLLGFLELGLEHGEHLISFDVGHVVCHLRIRGELGWNIIFVVSMQLSFQPFKCIFFTSFE